MSSWGWKRRKQISSNDKAATPLYSSVTRSELQRWANPCFTAHSAAASGGAFLPLQLAAFLRSKGGKKTSPGFLAPWWKFTPPLRRYFSFFCFFFSPSCHHSWCLWAALNTSFKCGCPPEELSHPAWTPTLAMWAPWQNRCAIIHCVSGALPASFRHPFFGGGGFSWDGVRQRLDTQSPPEEQQPGSAPFELLLVHYSVFNFLPFAMNNLSFMFPF